MTVLSALPDTRTIPLTELGEDPPTAVLDRIFPTAPPVPVAAFNSAI